MIKVKKLGYRYRSAARVGYKAACAKTPALDGLPHEVVEEDGRFFVRVATVDPEIAKAAQEAGLKVIGAAPIAVEGEPVLVRVPVVFPIDEARAAEAALQEAEAIQPTLAEHEASVAARATSYRVHLFLGRGQYDQSEVGTLEEAKELGVAMKAAHPTCTREPMIYAISPDGASTMIPAKEKRTKAAKPLPERAAPTWPVHKDYFAKRADAVGEANVILGEAAKELTDFVLCKLAVAESGCRKWYWVSMEQVEAEWSGRQRIDAGIAPKGRPGSEPKPKAERTPRAPKAAADQEKGCTWFEAEAYAPPPHGARKELYDACLAGKLPPEPDFSAATHTRFRLKLAAIVAAVHAGDLDALKAIRINAITSSPKALEKYRQLAVIALEAKSNEVKAA